MSPLAIHHRLEDFQVVGCLPSRHSDHSGVDREVAVRRAVCRASRDARIMFIVQ